MLDLQRLIGSQAYDDECQKFIEEEIYGHSGMFPNAITAWTSQSQHQKQGLDGIQIGDSLYFSPNSGNGYNGHTGIYQGNGKMLSATDNGVKISDIGNWLSSTGQQLLGYIPTSNPQVRSQLITLHGGSANNQQLDAQSANMVGSQSNQLTPQQWQQKYQVAQDAANWFSQYQQKNNQNLMGINLPQRANNYSVPVTPGMNATSTGPENWLSRYVS